ncbi:hypothetical protein WA026_010603 [Henosepilachna vigintioctopunctata]|uniref:Uncharacterized protein n=1 Tax=Henosepilachna vigintioctopunctata TaxID=420089 RepID=A0AAW1VCP2_9CUCU
MILPDSRRCKIKGEIRIHNDEEANTEHNRIRMRGQSIASLRDRARYASLMDYSPLNSRIGTRTAFENSRERAPLRRETRTSKGCIIIIWTYWGVMDRGLWNIVSLTDRRIDNAT